MAVQGALFEDDPLWWRPVTCRRCRRVLRSRRSRARGIGPGCERRDRGLPPRRRSWRRLRAVA
ncbi:DUF6011 domain-containing protein [Streptomyces cellulosae]|uniref:DUF6011 domain-containing protein n=1 Tax=Streptomyces cellulosae TaxID=1968 RepID=A0ABW6JM93_STRCE